MDTMNWAGQVCEQALRQTVPFLMLAAWLTILASLLCWAGASLTRRPR